MIEERTNNQNKDNSKNLNIYKDMIQMKKHLMHLSIEFQLDNKLNLILINNGSN
jgi:hypothetical protein